MGNQIFKTEKNEASAVTTVGGSVDIPEGWTSPNFQIPIFGKVVEVMFDNGEKAVGYYYDNWNRSGWMCNKGDGLFANYIWSGQRVIAWR